MHAEEGRTPSVRLHPVLCHAQVHYHYVHGLSLDVEEIYEAEQKHTKY